MITSTNRKIENYGAKQRLNLTKTFSNFKGKLS